MKLEPSEPFVLIDVTRAHLYVHMLERFQPFHIWLLSLPGATKLRKEAPRQSHRRIPALMVRNA
jgi:hypothetical protein